MYVDVCQAVAEEVVEERDVEETTLDPVALGVTVEKEDIKDVLEEGDVEVGALDPVKCIAVLSIPEDEVEGGHEEDVPPDEEKERPIFPRTERVGEEDEDEESANDLEEVLVRLWFLLILGLFFSFNVQCSLVNY